jgi:hypothetical protein
MRYSAPRAIIVLAAAAPAAVNGWRRSRPPSKLLPGKRTLWRPADKIPAVDRQALRERVQRLLKECEAERDRLKAAGFEMLMAA